jgi:hypothetical protein
VLASTGDLRTTGRKVLDCSAKIVIGLWEGSPIVARLIVKLDSSPAATSAQNGDSAASRDSNTSHNRSMTTTDGAAPSDSRGADKSPTGGGVSSDNAS